MLKLLGNSAYGRMIEALERQTNTIYTRDEKVVDRAMRSPFFEDLDVYELDSRKPRIVIRRPFQVGITVYQLDKYIDRKDFELVQMDTDSNYLATSGEKLGDIVKPNL